MIRIRFFGPGELNQNTLGTEQQNETCVDSTPADPASSRRLTDWLAEVAKRNGNSIRGLVPDLSQTVADVNSSSKGESTNLSGHTPGRGSSFSESQNGDRRIREKQTTVVDRSGVSQSHASSVNQHSLMASLRSHLPLETPTTNLSRHRQHSIVNVAHPLWHLPSSIFIAQLGSHGINNRLGIHHQQQPVRSFACVHQHC